MTKVGAEGPSHGGGVYCEVEGCASELPVESLRQEGLFMPTPQPLALDREIELFLRSAVGEIVLRGLVVQVIACAEAAAQGRSPGYGVLFLDLKDRERAWIARTRATAETVRLPSTAHARPASTPVTPVTAAAPIPVSAPAAPKAGPRIDDAVERARIARKTGSTTLRTSARAQLEAELAALKARAPADIFGPAAAQDPEAAQRAFLALAKRYHPHVFARFDSPEITRLATEIFILYKRAHTALRTGGKDGSAARAEGTEAPRSKSIPPPKAAASPRPSMRPSPTPSTRPAPMPSMRPSPTPSMRPSPTPSMRPGSASLRPSGGRASVPPPGADPRARRIADAELLLASAVRHLAATRYEQAESELSRAAALAPERIDIAVFRHLCRARAHKAQGRPDESLAAYRKVLELDPQHREAREQLEVPGERRRGLVSKWLGRNDE